MHSFFEWLSELEKSTQLMLFLLVAACMIIIPYASFIKRYILHLIKPQPLQIEFFELESSPHVYVGKDRQGAELYAEVAGEGIFIDGCAATLIWKVTGAKNIDIHPVGKSLDGNAATVIIDASQPQYTLTATGFNGKTITAGIRIPDRELYHLDVAPLGDLVTTGNNRTLATEPLTESLPKNRCFTKDQPIVGSRNSLIGPNISHLNPEPVALRNDKRRELHTALDKRRILAVYNYSTTKYNAIKHFFNENETDYSNPIKQ
jgi:hypothetical protein